MKLLNTFNQLQTLSSVMQVEGWESALLQGSCTVYSAYFIKLALDGCDIQDIDKKFSEHSADIAELQQRGFNLNYQGYDGYGEVLKVVGLKWESEDYSNAFSDFKSGNVALCLMEGNQEAHTIAFLYHHQSQIIYMFDPNFGLYKCDNTPLNMFEFAKFRLDNGYKNYSKFTFRNVGLMWQ